MVARRKAKEQDGNVAVAELDPQEWRGWPIDRMTDDASVLELCRVRGIETLRDALEGLLDGSIESDAMTDAFERLWKRFSAACPGFEQSPFEAAVDDTAIREDPSADDGDPVASSLCDEKRLKSLERKERLLEKIKRLSERGRQAEAKWQALKAEASSAKKEWEKQIARLQKAIADAKSPQLRLPGTEDDDEDVDADPVIEVEAETTAQVIDDDSWKAVVMSDLGVKGKLLERLTEAGIDNLGQWTEWHGKGTFRDPIKGVGEGAISKIADLCEVFWASRTAAIANDDTSAERVSETLAGRRVKLVIDLPGLEKHGFAAGSEHSIIRDDGDKVFLSGGDETEVPLLAGEFELIEA
jgi:hypothetical protein